MAYNCIIKGMSFTANSTGGEYAHTLTVSEIPSHRHEWGRPPMRTVEFKSGTAVYGTKDGVYNIITDYTSHIGGDESHNNIQPYITVYFWRRTA